MRKDEPYIKNILTEAFKGVGNFQRFEFCYYSGSARHDFVILDDEHFTYFEIKSEFDSFARFQQQSNRSHGYFNRRYLVIPESKISEAEKEIKKAEVYGICQWGYYVLEDLENGITEPRSNSYMGHIDMKGLSDMLWATEKRAFIKERAKQAGVKPFLVSCYEENKFRKTTLSGMKAHELDWWFPILFSQGEIMPILNKAFRERNFDMFKVRS